jgi:hypothetical protein
MDEVSEGFKAAVPNDELGTLKSKMSQNKA